MFGRRAKFQTNVKQCEDKQFSFSDLTQFGILICLFSMHVFSFRMFKACLLGSILVNGANRTVSSLPFVDPKPKRSYTTSLWARSSCITFMTDGCLEVFF